MVVSVVGFTKLSIGSIPLDVEVIGGNDSAPREGNLTLST